MSRDARPVAPFVALVFGMGVVFYLLGPLIGSLSRFTRAEVPASALMFICPGIAAALLVRRGGGSLRRWFAAALRPPGAAQAAWYVPIVLLAPAILVASYLVMRWTGMPLPAEPRVPWLAAPLLAVVYLVPAFCEELGWTAYATDRLLGRWGVLATGLAIGAAWGLWHVVPYWQGGHDARWIAGQVLFTVGFRVILVWLYARTGATMAAVVAHASYNVAWALFPNDASHYDPVVTGLVTAAVAALVVVPWGRIRSSGQR